MLSKVYKALLPVMFICLIFCGHCQAQDEYIFETGVPVNGYFWMTGTDDAQYEYDHDIVEVIDEASRVRFNFKKPGDTVISFIYVISENPLKTVTEKLLVHVYPIEEFRPEQWGVFSGNIIAEESDEPTPMEVSAFPARVLELVNIERAKVGARPLELADDLQSGAMKRAQELAIVFSHDRPDGSQCFTVLGKQRGGTSLGENIAAGALTPEAVVEQWMNSPGHRKNMLDKHYKELGVGYCYNAAGVGGYMHYWVQMFRGR